MWKIQLKQASNKDNFWSNKGPSKNDVTKGGGRVEIFLKNDDGMMTVGGGGLAAKPPKEIPQGEGGGRVSEIWKWWRLGDGGGRIEAQKSANN